MSFFRRHSAKKKKENVPTKQKPHPQNFTAPVVELQLDEDHEGQGAAGPGNKSQKSGLLLLQDDYHPGDLGVSSGSKDAYSKKSSRLSRCLNEMVKDHEATPYLIQYLESCKAAALIRFWLDAESFQASTWTRIRTHSLNSVSKSSLIKEKSNMKKSRSLNQDITSPSSLVSEDSAYHEIKSESTEALSISTDSSSQQVYENDNHVANHTSHECSPGDLENRDIPNSFPPCAETSGKSLPSADSDDRVREKCKLDQEKSAFSLPLKSCDINSAITNQTDKGSAISYRDLTSPSPTSIDDTNSDTKSLGTKPAVSPGVSSSSKLSLAEKLKKSVEQDAVRIFTKYLAMEATHPIGVSDDLRNNTIRKICREDGQVDPECFVDCQKFVLDKIEREHFESFKDSVYHAKYQVEVLTSGKLCLADVLYNDTALFYFMEYMEQEDLSHLLHFVIAADNFEQLLSSQQTYDGVQAQGDAMVLYDKYFSLQARSPLGFPDTVRFEVESNICREEGPLPECFASPRHIVLHTIEKLHFPRYITSDTYYRYLSELVSAVQTAQDFPLGMRKRKGSESSSEHSVGGHSVGGHSVGGESISSKNTLLASGNSRRVQLHKLDENMKNLTMDPGLLNPDSLWQRQEAGRLSLGKIDSLGHFVSSFVPDPETEGSLKRKQSTGSRFFRSKKDKEKEQEEMAKKVAEMILQDVTSVTQAISAIKNTSMDKQGSA